MKKTSLITITVIVAIIILIIILTNQPAKGVSKETAQCIADNSELYVKLGCHTCETQKKMFGNSCQYLNVIDCFFERDKCKDIIITPTWIINGETYEEVFSIEELKELTGCN